MRKIKFRMWNNCEFKENSKMFYDTEQVMNCLIQQIDYEDTIVGGYNHIGDGNSFMQFTGLKDKNEKEIYEGDVLGFSEKSKSIVTFDNGGFEIFGEPIGWTFDQESGFSKYDFKYCEVIGNIHENPELL